MVSVAKWLTHRIVDPARVGSIPITHPIMGSSQAVRQRTLTPSCEGSIPSSPANYHVPVAQPDRVLDYESRGREFESLRARHLRSIAQLGSAPALGAGGRGFESRCSDQPDLLIWGIEF